MLDREYQTTRITCPSCSKLHKVRIYSFDDVYECPNTGKTFQVNHKQVGTLIDSNEDVPDVSNRSVKEYEELLPLLQFPSSENKEKKKPLSSPLQSKAREINPQQMVTKKRKAVSSQDIYFDPLKKYKIIEKVNEGGFGVIYKALDNVLQRNVAIKVNKFSLDSHGITAFKQEAKILAQLNHPNIVHVYDFGISEQNFPYIVMEFLESEDIRTAMSELAQKDRTQLFLNVCKYFSELTDALSYLHRRNLYHQDIKPENILFSWETGSAKLVDFGLANKGNKQLEEFSGTLRYSAPERFEGDYSPSATSDIYSLGVVLYEVLTGNVPFPGGSAPEILASIFTKEVSFDEKDKIDPALKKICLKAIHRNPQERYQEAQEFQLDLAYYKANITKFSNYPYLYLVDKEKSIIVFPLTKRKNYIGRSFGNDIIIQNPKISRLHASIEIEEDNIIIENLSETNPIKVSNKFIYYRQKSPLQQNDRIEVFEYIFFFVEKNRDHNREEDTKEIDLEKTQPLTEEKEDNWISFHDALELLQENSAGLSRLIANGRIQTYKEGARIKLRSSDIHSIRKERVNFTTISTDPDNDEIDINALNQFTIEEREDDEFDI